MNRKLLYQCQRCTACCRWPGDVRLTDDELPALAAFLGLSVEGFIQTHTRLNQHRTGLSLHEHPDGTCVWLEGNDCRLQAVKPAQCRGFPNDWNFPGWRDVCRAVPVPVPEAPAEEEAPAEAG